MRADWVTARCWGRRSLGHRTGVIAGCWGSIGLWHAIAAHVVQCLRCIALHCLEGTIDVCLCALQKQHAADDSGCPSHDLGPSPA